MGAPAGDGGIVIGRSRRVAGAGYTGPISPLLWAVIRKAWSGPISLESNYARKYRHEVALAASLGYLTVIHIDGTQYTRRWHVTAEGAFAYRHNHLEQQCGK